MSSPTPRDALGRQAPADADQDVLVAWDDYPVHQAADVLSSVTPSLPGWAERFYFNALRPTGEIALIVGGGLYPARGISEFYLCRLDGQRQVNVRMWQPLPAPGAELDDGAFSLRCDSPLSDWSVKIDLPEDRFSGRFSGSVPPFLYGTIDIPASEPDGPFDRFRHFIALGRWQLDEAAGVDTSGGLLGVRDRTWGVRTRRPRLHLWSVLELGDGCLALKRQERADGSVMFSEAAVTHADGSIDRLEILDHDLVFDRAERQVVRGRVQLTLERGPLTVEFERAGTGIRLAGAGYDAGQGDRGTTSGVERDEYDLTDPDVAARTGRGTIDVGVRAQFTGAWSAEGIGVVETAIARDHIRYGRQVIPA